MRSKTGNSTRLRSGRLLLRWVILGLALTLFLVDPPIARATSYSYSESFENGVPSDGFWNTPNAHPVDTGCTTTQGAPGYATGYSWVYTSSFAGHNDVLSQNMVSGETMRISAVFDLSVPATINSISVDTNRIKLGDQGDYSYVFLAGCDSDDNLTGYYDIGFVGFGGGWITTSCSALCAGWTDTSTLYVVFIGNGHANSQYYIDNLNITVTPTDPADDLINPFGGFPTTLKPLVADDLLEHDTPLDESMEFDGVSLVTSRHDATLYASISGAVTEINRDGSIYSVRLENADQTVHYANLTNVFASLGDSVDAGCILGTAGVEFAETVGTYVQDISQFYYSQYQTIPGDVGYQDWTVHDDPNGSVTCGAGAPLQPFAEDDYLEQITASNVFGEFTSVSRVTSEQGADVYAVISGKVTEVTSVGALGGYNVRVNDYTGEYSAVYGNVTRLNVSVGDNIEKGCILGRSGTQYAATTEDTYSQTVGQIVFGVYRLSVTAWEDWRYFPFPDPVGAVACNSSVSSENCINSNPNMRNRLQSWRLTGPVSAITNDSVTLDPGSSIYQDVVLDSATGPYYVTLGAMALGDYTPALRVSLGADSADTDFVFFDGVQPYHAGYETSAGLGTLTTTYSPDIYRLTITNDTAREMRLYLACLEESGTVSITPGVCYFPSWDFSTLPTGWTFNLGAAWNGTVFGGYIDIPDLAPPDVPDITHGITLEGDDSGGTDYRLVVKGRGGPLPAGFTTFFSNSTGVLGNLVIYDPIAMGDLWTDSYDARNAGIMATIYDDIISVPESTTWSGDFILDVTSGGAYFTRLEVASVCISPVDGIWPGFEDAEPGIIGETCDVCGIPSGINPAEWLAWLGCLLRQLWFCYISGLINNIFQTLIRIASGLGYIGRFMSALLQMTLGWWLAIVRQLLTGLANLLGYLAVAFWNGITGLPAIRLLYDLITSLLAGLTSTIPDLISSLIADIMLGFAGIAALGRVVLIFWGNLQTEINATSTVDLGIPDCMAPEPSLPDLCTALSMVDTVMSEPGLAALGVVVAAGVGLFTIIYTVRRVGAILGDFG